MPRNRQVENYKRDLERIKLGQEKLKLRKLEGNFIKRSVYRPKDAVVEEDIRLIRYFDRLISRLNDRQNYENQLTLKTGLTLKDLKTMSDEKLLTRLITGPGETF